MPTTSSGTPQSKTPEAATYQMKLVTAPMGSSMMNPLLESPQMANQPSLTSPSPPSPSSRTWTGRLSWIWPSPDHHLMCYKYKTPEKWKKTYIDFRKADWPTFTESTEAEFEKLIPTVDVYRGEKCFRTILNRASKNASPKDESRISLQKSPWMLRTKWK